MIQKRYDNLDDFEKASTERCLNCKELLIHLEQFFNMLEAARRTPTSDWLTVDDIAKELRISKSIVYRLIRNGEIEAVNLVENNGKISQKGHYRIKRSSLDQCLESKKVTPLPSQSIRISQSKRFPKVRNHLGL